MKDLKVTTVQTALAWQNKRENYDRLQELIDTQKDLGDIIILPEMFNTGFSMDAAALAEPSEGETLNWMKVIAAKYDLVVCGSYIVSLDNKFYNRFQWVEPNGNTASYDKRHLFRMADEDKHFSGGKRKLIINYKGWNICPMICYDLRFPVWSRNRFINGSYEYDLLLYVANWPAPRANAWRDLLHARAHENQCYVVGVNRTGKDGNDIDYSGDTLVISPKGEKLYDAGINAGEIGTTVIKGNELNEFREKFPVYLDADAFYLK